MIGENSVLARTMGRVASKPRIPSLHPMSMIQLRIVLIFFAALAGLFCHPARGDDAARESSFRDSLLPLLRTYCFECHDEGSEVPLGKDESVVQLQANRKTWIRALAQVRLGAMPPEDGPPMDGATRDRMAKLIDDLANAVDCVRNPNAGKVTLRRLNRAEYRNTVRDLTGVDYEPAEGFPGDDVGYGFDNIGDVLSLPPLLIEKYWMPRSTFRAKQSTRRLHRKSMKSTKPLRR